MHYNHIRLIDTNEKLENHKGHLQMLGTCPGYNPDKKGNKDIIVLFTVSGRAAATWVARSAAWARRSFYLNTDAADLGIDICLFIESKVLDTLDTDMLNNIPDEHIYVSESSDKIHPWTFKLSPACIDTFDAYKYIVIVDADYFACNSLDVPDNYFADMLTYLEAYETPVIGVHQVHESEGVHRFARKLTDKASFKLKYPELDIPNSFLDKIFDPNRKTTKVSGGFYLFALNKTGSEKQILRQLSTYIHDDENAVECLLGYGIECIDVRCGRNLLFSRGLRGEDLEKMDGFYFYHSHRDYQAIRKWLEHSKILSQ